MHEALAGLRLADLRLPAHIQPGEVHIRPNERPMAPWEERMLRAIQPQAKTAYKELVHKTIESAFQDDGLTLTDTRLDRIKACWRITREMARTKRVLSYDEPLVTLKLNDLTLPNDDKQNAYQTKQEDSVSQDYINACKDAIRLKEMYWCHVVPMGRPKQIENIAEDHYTPNPQQTQQTPLRIETKHLRKAGLPILPPLPPEHYLHPTTRQVTRAYTTKDDPLLNIYVHAVNMIADHLNLYEGSLNHPNQGIRGMAGLANPDLTRQAFATLSEMVAWEYVLLDEVLDLVVKRSAKEAHKYLKEEHGLTYQEIKGFLQLTRRYATSMMQADRAEDKAVVLLRCEELLDRAQTAFDMKTETAMLKHISAIMGLTRGEQDESLEDLIEVTRNHADNRPTQHNPVDGIRLRLLDKAPREIEIDAKAEKVVG